MEDFSFDMSCIQEPIFGDMTSPFTQESIFGDITSPFTQESIFGDITSPFTQESIFGGMTSPFTQESIFGGMTSPFTQEPIFDGMTSPFTQEPIFEGSYVVDENVAMSCFGDFTDPAYQNPEQYLEYPPYPENPADLHQSQEDEQPSENSAPRRPCGGGYRPPPKYTAPRNVAHRYGPPRPQGMQATTQQPAYPAHTANYPRQATTQQPAYPAPTANYPRQATTQQPAYPAPTANYPRQATTQQPAYPAPTANYPRQATTQQPAYPAPTANYPRQATTQQPAYPAPTANYPRPVVPIYPPPATGQWVVAQPQGFGSQAPAIIVQPMLQDPPNDFLGYSIFVCLCCCWIIGLVAIFKSIECRRAIDVGNRELANKKSKGARNSAHASLALGILAYIIVAGFIIGICVA